MLIQVVNPNATAAMTDVIAAAARAAAAPDVSVEAVTNAAAPVSIESAYDEALAVPGLLAAVREPADGYVVACFGDPGLDAAREVAAGPVVGIAEAAMRTATYLGRSFSVVTTLARTTGRTEELVDRYGVRPLCRSVRACEVPVLGLAGNPDAYRRVLAECRAAVECDGAECLVLGCAGMADLCAELAAELGVPVVDGVAAAVATVSGLVRLGLSTSRVGGYARPPAKPVTGPLASLWLG
ncbi:aspartate/glutamate racemase family protein [Modestobacter marinus]|uniref:aspartate/glutamate racemase family protein n=1 Tax=Modestobacter marinus TaxID=477641 RepID=UPI0027DF0FFB|nr:aspartate/glutamate racemase family protein [Modestobacter marinus]